MCPSAGGVPDLYVDGMAGGALIGSQRRAWWPCFAPACRVDRINSVLETSKPKLVLLFSFATFKANEKKKTNGECTSEVDHDHKKNGENILAFKGRRSSVLTCSLFADVGQVVVAGHIVPFAVLVCNHHYAVLPAGKKVVRLVLAPVFVLLHVRTGQRGRERVRDREIEKERERLSQFD